MYRKGCHPLLQALQEFVCMPPLFARAPSAPATSSPLPPWVPSLPCLVARCRGRSGSALACPASRLPPAPCGRPPHARLAHSFGSVAAPRASICCLCMLRSGPCCMQVMHGAGSLQAAFALVWTAAVNAAAAAARLRPVPLPLTLPLRFNYFNLATHHNHHLPPIPPGPRAAAQQEQQPEQPDPPSHALACCPAALHPAIQSPTPLPSAVPPAPDVPCRVPPHHRSHQPCPDRDHQPPGRAAAGRHGVATARHGMAGGWQAAQLAPHRQRPTTQPPHARTHALARAHVDAWQACRPVTAAA